MNKSINEIKEIIDFYFDQYVNDLESLIAIRSVYEEDDSGKPFGRNIDMALKQMLDICKRLGFNTYYDEAGYYGYAEIGNQSKMVGILGHLDVVSEGDLLDWVTNPYQLTIKNNRVYGRGVQDDKGPLLCTIYATKILLDLGYKFNNKVRFIFGTDEELLWRDINRYVAIETIPDLAFSPDSKFPLIYAEKGLLQLKLTSKNWSDLRIKGGDAFNVVPSKFKVNNINLSDFMESLKRLNYEYQYDNNEVTVLGKSVHAQIAENGINAISRTLIALYDMGYRSNIIDFVFDLIKEDVFATNIFGNVADEISGKLKFNIGKVEFNDDYEQLMIDIRIPVQTSKDFVVGKINDIIGKYNLEYNEHDYLRSIYVPLDSVLIRELMNAYQTVTNDYLSQPVSSGGATYARAMDNCVAFGAVLSGSLKTEHQPNESMSIDDLKTAIEIYIEAIKRLTNSEEDPNEEKI